MRVNTTHNEHVRTFKDIVSHLELEDERLEAAKISHAYVVESNSRGAFEFGQKKIGSASNKGNVALKPKKVIKRKRGK